MKQFEIDEILIAQHFVQMPEYNGQECIVIAGLEEREVINLTTMTITGKAFTYRVQFSDGMIVGPLPHQLRRKKPPESPNERDADFGKLVEWKDCVWSPHEVLV